MNTRRHIRERLKGWINL